MRNPFLRWLNDPLRRELGYVVLIAIAPLVCLAIVAPFGLANTGLLHTVGVPPWLALLVLFLALKLLGYCFHRAVHAVQHSSTGRNCTTARRQHTLEVVIGAVVALAVLLALVLGPDVWILAAYHALQSLRATVHHANLSFGAGLDQYLHAPSHSTPLKPGYCRAPREGRIDALLTLPFSWHRNHAEARKA